MAMTHFGSGIWSYKRRTTGAILRVTRPDTIIRSDWRGEARYTSAPKRARSKREANAAIISIAQQARPNSSGHTELARAQATACSTPVSTMPESPSLACASSLVCPCIRFWLVISSLRSPPRPASARRQIGLAIQRPDVLDQQPNAVVQIVQMNHLGRGVHVAVGDGDDADGDARSAIGHHVGVSARAAKLDFHLVWDVVGAR